MKYSVNALHKTATVFLGKFFKEVSKAKKCKFYSRDVSKTNAGLFKRQRHSILCPARGFPKKLDDDIFYIFVMRNPLDMLVSEYFSFGWTHPIKDDAGDQNFIIKVREDIQTLSIDDYCLKYADILYDKFLPLLKMISSKQYDNFNLNTYEELVTDFKLWTYKIFDVIEVPEEKREAIYMKFKGEFENVKEIPPDKIISGELKDHKRKMLPGDHKEKLKNLTVVKLNHKFKKILKIHKSINP